MFAIVNKNSFFKKKIKSKNFYHFTGKNFSVSKLKKIQPKIIFFPHWSKNIPASIYTKFLCIGFHSSPLPFGRGGSPIHNMIIRNHKKTLICAFKIQKGLDKGPIALKKSMSLRGNGHEIFDRLYNQILLMIKSIIKIKQIKFNKQKGNIVKFKRLSRTDSQLGKEKNIIQIFNKIRMLDMRDKNFLNANIRLNNFSIYLTNPKYKKKSIKCEAQLKLNDK